MYFNRKNAEQKNWRMIKKGKHFLFGCSLVFAIGAALVAPSVKADTVEANPEAGSTTEGIKPVVAEEDVTYAAPAVEVAPSAVAPAPVVTEEKAEKPVATTENAKEEAVVTTTVSVDKSQLEAVLAQAKAKNLDGQEASVKIEVAAAIAEAEALVANDSASQEQVNQSVERLTQALANVKEVTEVATEKTSEATAESSETPKVRSRRATTDDSLLSVDKHAVVTKDNFESFFQIGGTASYDKSTGTIQLTEDVKHQAGNAYLRFKIDSNKDFTFTGKVDIGNKYEGHDVDNRVGGDGVGFVFHTGNVDKLGQNGASVGMGTIKNAFGFKLDSYHNTKNPAAKDNSIKDPQYGNINNAFGAFYSSNAGGKVDLISDAKALTPAPNGQWVDFKIDYKGDSKQFTVTYGNQTWSTNITSKNNKITYGARTELSKSNALYALSFAASTGGATNLQRVQIERFEFTAPQIIHMKFVDTKGNEIEAKSAIPGGIGDVINLSTQASKIAAVEAKGYKFKEIDHSKAPSYKEGDNTVTLTEKAQSLTYIFEEKDTTAPASPKVNPVTAGATAVTGTAEAGSTVEVTLPDGTKATATADKDGNYSVPVSALKEGDTVSVTATDAAGNKSGATSATVPDTTAPAAPKVNPVTAGATAVTGTAEAGSTVEVTLPDGTKKSATADKDGNYSVPVSGLEEGQTVSVTAKDASNNTSTPTTATVAKADDKTAPDAPVVNPVKAGDTAVTGTAEAGSTVEVTLPNGSKVSAKADKDGNYSVPVSGLKEGDKVSVTATDESGNTSATTTTTTTVTVSNVNVGGKEADNAKVPALTPVVDPNNLTDAEKAKVAEEVKKANPTATDVKVNNDGSVVVTFADGSVATIAANKVVKEATKDSSAQAPAKKAGAKELPNTGTKQSNASLGLALLAAVTGGLLVSKKRKEEE